LKKQKLLYQRKDEWKQTIHCQDRIHLARVCMQVLRLEGMMKEEVNIVYEVLSGVQSLQYHSLNKMGHVNVKI
jgi:hypothetical protein